MNAIAVVSAGSSREPGEAELAQVRLGRGRRPQARKLRDAKDALYREHIMEVAEGIFAEQGFSNTKMQDIASQAGVSLATLYQSYPSKQDLYRGVLIARDRQMLNLVLAQGSVGQGMPESVEHLLLFMEAHLGFMLGHPNYLRMQLQEGHAWYNGSARPTHDEQQIWDQGLGFLEQVLAWGMQQGMFSPGEPRHVARLMLSTQQTRMANWVMDGMRAPHESVIEAIQADFVRLFCPPATAARLLAPDGRGLSRKTLKSIRALDLARSQATPGGTGGGR